MIFINIIVKFPFSIAVTYFYRVYIVFNTTFGLIWQ